MKPEYLKPAKECLKRAQKELVNAVFHLNDTGGDFEKTTSDIKEVIGDLECAISAFERHGV